MVFSGLTWSDPLNPAQPRIPGIHNPFVKNSASGRSYAGIAWLVCGFVLLVLSDATAKLLSESHSVMQVVSLRSLVLVSVLATFFAVTNRRELLHPGDLKMQSIRGSLACCSQYLFIFGISYVQLAEAAAAVYLGPIIMTALAPVILGERVGMHRWGAVLFGFFGMLVMLRPSADGLAWAMLLPASSAVFGALRDLVTRKMRSSGHPVTVLLYSNIIITAVGLPVLLSVWQPFTLPQFGLLVLSSALIGCAHLMHIHAFRIEEASLLAPFRYTGIIWGVLFGFLIWGQLPDNQVFVGAVLVIVSGLYIYRRERRQSNK